MNGLDLGNLVAHINLDNIGFMSAIKATENALVKSVSRMSDNLVKWTKRSAVAYAVASTKAFADFEQEIMTVSTMLDEQSGKYLPSYSRAIKEMSVQFGESTATLSRGLYNILSASIPADKAIQTLDVTVKAAAAGLTETSTAAYAITGILNAYSMSADEAGKVSDILFATVKRGQTTFAELAPVIGKVTSVAAVANVKLEEVTAALATITRAGIGTAEAVTYLRSSLIALQGKGEDNVKLAREWGIELSINSLKVNGLSGMLNKLNKLSDEQFKKIFTDIRSRQALVVLLQSQAGFMKDLDTTMNAAGMTQEAFNKISNTLSYTLRRLWQTMKYISVEVGEKLAPSITKLTDTIINNKDKIAKWATDIAIIITSVIETVIEIISILASNDFNKEFQHVLDIMLAGFIAFGKSAVDLAFRTGKGMIKALKAGILGDDLGEDELNRRAIEAYKNMQGAVEKIRERKTISEPIFGSPIPTVTTRQVITEREVPLDLEKYAQAVEKVTKEHEGRFVKSVFSGFPEAVKGYFNEAGQIATSSEMGKIGEAINSKLEIMKKRLEENSFNSKKIRDYTGETAKLYQGVSIITSDSIPKLEKTASIYGRIKELIKNLGTTFNEHLEEAKNLSESLGSALNSTFDSLADKITDVLSGAKVEWQQFTGEILKMWLNAMVKMQMAEFATSSLSGIKNLFSNKTPQNVLDKIPEKTLDWNKTGSMLELSPVTTSITTASTAITGALTGQTTALTTAISGASGAITGAIAAAAAVPDVSVGVAPNAYGNAFNAGNIIPFALGGMLNSIVNTPTYAPMSGNNTALIGEAGPEAVMPLTRDSSGRLGVQAKDSNAKIENKLKIVNVYDKEQMLAAMNTDAGEKMIMNKLRKFGVIR